MAELSPRAQAVLDAFNKGWEPNLAAALLAIAAELQHAANQGFNHECT